MSLLKFLPVCQGGFSHCDMLCCQEHLSVVTGSTSCGRSQNSGSSNSNGKTGKSTEITKRRRRKRREMLKSTRTLPSYPSFCNKYSVSMCHQQPSHVHRTLRSIASLRQRTSRTPSISNSILARGAWMASSALRKSMVLQSQRGRKKKLGSIRKQ